MARPQPTSQVIPLDADHADTLLRRLVHAIVKTCIDIDELSHVEERLAVELARIPGIDDAQMLSHARTFVAQALHELAEDWSTGRWTDDGELTNRYLNAICAEVG